MLKNAWITFAAFFAILWVGSIFLEQAILLFVPGLLAAVVVACTTRILGELGALRKELRDGAPAEADESPTLAARSGHTENK